MPDRSPPTGRVAEARRESTRAVIKAAARTELRTHGPACVGMRAVARAVGMPASSLYRFFCDHAALMTELRIDAYTALNNRLRVAQDAVDPGDPSAQWRAVARAFRSWSLDNPDEFVLLFCMAASGEAPWAPAVYQLRAEAATVVGTILQNARDTGQLTPITKGASISVDRPRWVNTAGQPLEPEIVQITLGCWAALVGHITLETRRSNIIADPQIHYEEYLDAVMEGMGFRHHREPTRSTRPQHQANVQKHQYSASPDTSAKSH